MLITQGGTMRPLTPDEEQVIARDGTAVQRALLEP